MQNNESYLKRPQVIANLGTDYASTTRVSQGISSLACGRDGRLWAVWYGGISPGEDHNNPVILAVSTDSGAIWSDEKLVVDPDGDQAEDGSIGITYDYDRKGDRDILMAAFREEDVWAGDASAATVRLRKRINTARP